MPAAAIVGAVVATVAAVEAVGTIATIFAVAAAVGSAAAAVGQIAGVKELTIAGTVLGAVGGLGSIATSAGLFGAEAGSFFGGVTNTAGGAAADATELSVVAGAPPPGGYTWETAVSYDPSLGGIPAPYLSEAAGGTGAAQAGTAPVPEGQIVNMINGSVREVSAPLADAPTPVNSADFLPKAAVDQVANPEGLVPDPAKGLAVDPVDGLINQQIPTPAEVPAVDLSTQVTNPNDLIANANVAPSDPAQAALAGTDPTSPFGQTIAQGGDEGGTLGGFNNPAAPQEGGLIQQAGESAYTNMDMGAASRQGGYGVTGQNAPLPGQDITNSYQTAYDQTGNIIPQGDGGPSGSPAGSQPATSTAAAPGTQPASVTPAQQTPVGQAEANLSGFGAGQGPKGPAELAARNADGSLTVSPWDKIWDFTKKNDKFLLGALQAGGSFLSGALSPLNPAQVDALTAQAERNRAAANLESTQNELLQRRLNNMRQGIPQVRWKTDGLINMAPVTGRPA